MIRTLLNILFDPVKRVIFTIDDHGWSRHLLTQGHWVVDGDKVLFLGAKVARVRVAQGALGAAVFVIQTASCIRQSTAAVGDVLGIAVVGAASGVGRALELGVQDTGATVAELFSHVINLQPFRDQGQLFSLNLRTKCLY